MSKNINRFFSLKSDFEKLFFENEFSTLKGKKNSNIKWLSTMFFMTILSLAIAIGGYNYLSKKMEDPFTNWVNLQITYEDQKVFDEIQSHYSQDSLRKRYLIDTISPYKIITESAIVNGKQRLFKYRTLDSEDKIFDKIVNEDANIVYKTPDFAERITKNHFWIVISKNTADILSYDPTLGKPMKMAYVKTDTTRIVYLDIVAVVNNLPDECNYIATGKLQEILAGKDEEVFNSGENAYLKFILPINDEAFVKAAIESHLKYSVNTCAIESFRQYENKEAFLYKLNFKESDVNFQKITDSIALQVREVFKDKGFQFCVQPDDNIQKKGNEQNHYHYLAIKFSGLDSVRAFSENLKRNFNNTEDGRVKSNLIQINMAQVESKENFALVSKLTNFITIILFLFGGAFILFYLLNLLSKHINEVKTNLGTFMAFGLSNAVLVKAYTKIISFYIFICISLSLIAIMVIKLISSFFGYSWLIDLFNYQIAAALLLILSVCFIAVFRLLKNTLFATPGDLIYQREKTVTLSNNDLKITDVFSFQGFRSATFLKALKYIFATLGIAIATFLLYQNREKFKLNTPKQIVSTPENPTVVEDSIIKKDTKDTEAERLQREKLEAEKKKSVHVNKPIEEVKKDLEALANTYINAPTDKNYQKWKEYFTYNRNGTIDIDPYLFDLKDNNKDIKAIVFKVTEVYGEIHDPDK